MKKLNKYRNKKTVYKGITFDSERERDRYIFLKEKEDNGEIQDLRLQEKFELLPKVTHTEIQHLKTKDKEIIVTDQKAITYKCDFTYYRDDVYVVEDVKISEFLLPKEFILKEKMFFARYGFHITKIYKPTFWL